MWVGKTHCKRYGAEGHEPKSYPQYDAPIAILHAHVIGNVCSVKPVLVQGCIKESDKTEKNSVPDLLGAGSPYLLISSSESLPVAPTGWYCQTVRYVLAPRYEACFESRLNHSAPGSRLLATVLGAEL